MDHQHGIQGRVFRQKVYLLTCWLEEDEIASSVQWRFRLERTDQKTPQVFSATDHVLAEIQRDLDD